MANQEIKLNKNVFGKVSYPQIVNTEFSQLVQPNDIDPDATPLTVIEFGEVGSHRELVTRSSSYVGMTDQSGEMQALIDEISELRIQLLTAQQEVVNLSTQI